MGMQGARRQPVVLSCLFFALHDAALRALGGHLETWESAGLVCTQGRVYARLSSRRGFLAVSCRSAT